MAINHILTEGEHICQSDVTHEEIFITDYE